MRIVKWYGVNTVKYLEFATTKKTHQCFIKRYNQYAKINYLIAQDKMNQVLSCQPEIVILNNIIMSRSYYYREGVGDKLILCSKFFISSIPLFRSKSGPVENCLGPVDFWCSLVMVQCTFGNLFNPCAMVEVLLAFSSQVQYGFKPWWDQTKYFIFVAFPLSWQHSGIKTKAPESG